MSEDWCSASAEARAHVVASVATQRPGSKRKSPAKLGASIKAPFLVIDFESDALIADAGLILERVER